MRRFNVTGICVKSRHYMVDTSAKINKIINLIENEYYFTINRPRQYGKTTSLDLLYENLSEKYLVLSLSFEGVSQESFNDDKAFITMLYGRIKKQLQLNSEKSLLVLLEEMKGLRVFDELDDFISTFVKESDKEVILIIDECDDGSSSDVFLKFLGVLRNKYQRKIARRDITFKSVILAGVHDIKNLKYKVRGVDGSEKTNSSWNIAEEFNVEMSFNEIEIQSLLVDYLSEHPEIKMDVELIANKIHYFTNGYPFLVSYLCKMISERFDGLDKWNVYNLEQAVNELVLIKTTNFDSLINNIQNNQDLANLVQLILIDGEQIPYSNSGPAMEIGLMYGVLARSKDNKLVIHNPIYEIKIYSYLMDKMKTENADLLRRRPVADYTTINGALDMPLILEKYSEYLKDLHDDHQDRFIENNARLLFSIFIKSIINQVGFMYREPVITDRRRLDVVITYNQFKYVIELKIWYGDAYFELAKTQLADYLEREKLDIGYMIVHDFRKKQHRRYTSELLTVNGKELKVYFV